MRVDARLVGLAPDHGDVKIGPADSWESSVQSYSLRDAVPGEIAEMIWEMLGGVDENDVNLSSAPQREEVVGLRAGIMLSSVLLLHDYGSLRAAEGDWIDSRAMWIYQVLRLWEHDDTMTQKQQVFSRFQIGKTSYWQRVRAVEALERVRHIPFDVITSCPHKTVWYAIADRVLGDEPWLDDQGVPVDDQQVMDWLTSGLGANDLVAVIAGHEPTMDQQISRFVGQATAMESLLRDRGIMVVQASDGAPLANMPGNGIIHGRDIVGGESVHVVMASGAGHRVHTYCPNCGSEIDPSRLVIHEEKEGIGD